MCNDDGPSMGQEAMFEQMMNYDYLKFAGYTLDEITEKYNHKDLYWTTQYNGAILVQNMTNSHLENSIKFLQKHYDYPDNRAILEWIEVFNLELSRRK